MSLKYEPSSEPCAGPTLSNLIRVQGFGLETHTVEYGGFVGGGFRVVT